MNRVAKLEEMLKANPTDSFLQHALALEYIKRGEEDVAEKLFKIILEREPGYVGSYYHLAKLLERKGDEAAAIQTYDRGMQQAQLAGDTHSLNELRMALEELDD